MHTCDIMKSFQSCSKLQYPYNMFTLYVSIDLSENDIIHLFVSNLDDAIYLFLSNPGDVIRLYYISCGTVYWATLA